MTRKLNLLASVALAAAVVYVSAPAHADEIKIGIVAPMTGQLASEGQDMENAVKLAFDQLNAKGGLKGETFTTITADDACDPQQGVTAAAKLASAGVAAIIGGYCSGAVLPTLKIYGDAGIPFVIPAANSMKLVAANMGNAFLIDSTGDAQALTAVKLFEKQGIKSIAIVDEGDAYSSDLAKLTAAAFEKTGGQIVAKETVAAGEPDFSALVSAIKAKNPDAVLWTAYHSGGALLTKQLRQAGYGGAIVLGDGNNSPEYLEIAGSAAEGAFLFSPPTLDTLPNAGAFKEAYKKAYERDPGAYAALSYDAGMLVGDAMARAGSPDAKAVIEALKTSDFTGLAGPVKFTDKNTLIGSNFAVLVAKNGKWELAP